MYGSSRYRYSENHDYVHGSRGQVPYTVEDPEGNPIPADQEDRNSRRNEQSQNAHRDQRARPSTPRPHDYSYYTRQRSTSGEEWQDPRSSFDRAAHFEDENDYSASGSYSSDASRGTHGAYYSSYHGENPRSSYFGSRRGYSRYSTYETEEPPRSSGYRYVRSPSYRGTSHRERGSECHGYGPYSTPRAESYTAGTYVNSGESEELPPGRYGSGNYRSRTFDTDEHGSGAYGHRPRYGSSRYDSGLDSNRFGNNDAFGMENLDLGPSENSYDEEDEYESSHRYQRRHRY